MYKYSKSQLPVTFNVYFKLVTNVHPCNTRQTKPQVRNLHYQMTLKLMYENVEVQCNRNLATNFFGHEK